MEILFSGSAEYADKPYVVKHVTQIDVTLEIKSCSCQDAAYLFLYVTEGSVSCYGSNESLKSHSLLIQLLNNEDNCIITFYGSIYVLLVTREYLKSVSYTGKLITGLVFRKDFGRSLTTLQDFKSFKGLLRLIEKHAYMENNAHSGDIVRLSFNILLQLITDTLTIRSNVVIAASTHTGHLISQFLFLVGIHIRQKHDVFFYADQLNISAGHLARILKESGHQSPKKIIETALIAEIIALLHDPSITLEVIAENLNLSGSSYLINFFKRQTGYTPSDYRRHKM